jgi:UDP-glucuronate 4-epimerase
VNASVVSLVGYGAPVAMGTLGWSSLTRRGTIAAGMSASSPAAATGCPRCLVTGAAGFIGSHLVDYLLATGHEVVGLDCFTDYYPRWMKERNLAPAARQPGFRLVEGDLRDMDLVALVRGTDVVFHLAAMGGLLRSWTWFDTYLTCNVLGTQRLLEAVRQVGVRHLIHASTSSVYGRDSSGDEHHPTCPDSPYGVTKLAAENLVLAYARNFGLPVTVLRYFSIYGPRQRPDMGYYIFIDRILRDEAVTIHGDGSAVRGNTYIDDCVAATLTAMDRGPAGEVFNIGGGESVSALEALHLIERIVGRQVQVTFGPARPGEQLRAVADTGKARRLLGWQPATGIEAGLRAQVAWQQTVRPREAVA